MNPHPDKSHLWSNTGLQPHFTLLRVNVSLLFSKRRDKCPSPLPIVHSHLAPVAGLQVQGWG